MRKLLIIWLAFCLFSGIAMAPFLPAQATDTDEASLIDSIRLNRYAEVITEKGTLNMRSEAKDKAKVVDRLPKGAIVLITDEIDEWTEVLYKGRTGFVKSNFLDEIIDLPYQTITKQSDGSTISAFKKALYKLDYIKSDEINNRFDWTMEVALAKLQLINGIELDPETVSPEVQALMEWGMIMKCKSGYIETAVDEDSGLTVSIFCWDIGGVLYESDKSVKLSLTYAAQAIGGQPPYSITVKKSVSGRGAESADEVSNPFSHIWGQDTERLYIYAVVSDAAGNTVTACVPYRYNLPSRYRD